jgi:hypothetical protein
VTVARRPTELGESKVAACLLAAMQRLHAQGYMLMGPKLIGREAAKDYGKEIVSTLASHYLRRLVESGDVARQPQGPRRGLYRLRRRHDTKEQG